MQSYRLRKIIHYSLIACVLLIQVIIAGVFYNEFTGKKNLSFVENQLKEIHSLEYLTNDSRKELLNSQDFFQKYLVSEDNKYLKSYFESINRLTKNLDSIDGLKDKNPRLKNVLSTIKKDSSEFKKFKVLIDSTYQVSKKSDFKIREELPVLKKYYFPADKEFFDIETNVFSDSIKKKGFFGRIGDAIAGKENVRKESIIITLKNGKTTTPSQMRKEIENLINSINNHYTKEVQKIQTNVTKNQDNSNRLYKIFSDLMVYSNNLMGIYELGIKDSKTALEKEYNKQNSKTNKIRQNLILGLMILMFIVSLLLMFLTRIAFVYEKKLKSANEQINENLKFKNRILGMLSHELRSPLKIIGIFINRIKKKTDDENIKEYLKSISFTNNTLLMQANQILEYTKNQQVENKLIPVRFNLKNEINSILNSLEPYIETRNNIFITNENINPDIEVFSDNTKINQIFMNILGNANKFTENGQISVNVKTENVDENTVLLTSEISDTGVGISQSDLEKIFEPYYQGVLSDDVENLGAGLGLSLCKELVELYSGKISASSELGKGTTVIFSVNLNNEQ